MAHGAAVMEWMPDLIELGYGAPLPAPSPAVQATLVAINAPRVHGFILEHEQAALLDCDDNGEYAPLLLKTLDLSQWTVILALAIKKDVDKSLEQLKLAQADLAAMLDFEAEELELATHNAKLVEAALRKANPHESSQSLIPLSGSAVTAPHPLLAGICLPQAQRAAVEDLASSIQSTQEDFDQARLTSSGKGLVVPFMPARSVEYEVALKAHRCWTLPNITLLAPISIHTWRTWSNLSLEEVDAIKVNVIHNTNLLKDPQDIPNSFPLAMYDHQKCNSAELKIHTKQDLQTGYGRNDKFISSLWNVQCPYLRCLYAKDARTGCRGDIMWFDQATWFMINNLGTFFPDADFPNLTSKFVAFVTWLSEAARVGVRHQIAFAYARELMVEASLELITNPHSRLLALHPDGMGLRKIERLMKPASFSVANPGTPSLGAMGKRPRGSINCNASPESSIAPSMHRDSRGRGFTRGVRGGRGGYNRKFRPTSHGPATHTPSHVPRVHGGQGSNANEAFVVLSTATRNSPVFKQLSVVDAPDPGNARSLGPSPSYQLSRNHSPTSARSEMHQSRAPPRFDRSAVKGKILNWDNIE